jgi:DNA polymerase III alpha subunit
MYTNEYNTVVFEEADIFNALYQNNVELNQLTVVSSEDIQRLVQVSNIQFDIFDETNILQYSSDKERQDNWFIPDEYKSFNIRKWVIQQCTSPDEIIRANQELVEFEKRNMIDLLRWLKYFVDSCNKRNIIIGVGRGSSVSSFVLYKIGVHKINSLKYNLDYREFLR